MPLRKNEEQECVANAAGQLEQQLAVFGGGVLGVVVEVMVGVVACGGWSQTRGKASAGAALEDGVRNVCDIVALPPAGCGNDSVAGADDSQRSSNDVTKTGIDDAMSLYKNDFILLRCQFS